MRAIRRAVSNWLSRAASKVAPKYVPPARCPVCKWTVRHHNPDCETLLATFTGEQWKERALKLRAERDEAFKGVRRAWKSAHDWEGKYHILRIENNALRKAARAARQEKENVNNERL